MKIRVGTRGSKPALAQTNYVVDRLKAAFPEKEILTPKLNEIINEKKYQ